MIDGRSPSTWNRSFHKETNRARLRCVEIRAASPETKFDKLATGPFQVTSYCILRLAVLVVRGHAHPRQFDCAADLGAGHVTFKAFSHIPSACVPVCDSDVQPHVREHGILEDALAIAVHEPEVGLRNGDTLLSRQAVPTHGFRVIQRHAPAGVVPGPEVELRNGDTLLSRQALPADRFGIVLRDPTATAVHDPEVDLCTGVALLSRQTVPAHGLGLVLEDTCAIGVPEPEVELRGGGFR